MSGTGLKILCAVDLNDTAHDAPVLRRAAQLARLDGAELDVMTVTPDFGSANVATFFKDGAQDTMIEETKARLHAFVSDTLGSDAGVRHVVACGPVYEEILAVADRIGAGLIVIGAHRPDLKDYLLGPNAARVARHATASVYIVRD